MPFPASPPAIERALAARGYDEPTPVQQAVLQPETADRDLLVSAQTGSGKTVAFGIAAAATLLGGEERLGPPGRPLALVVAPTRELAVQVHRELSWLYAEAGARLASCIGGMDPRAEQRALIGGCHVVVGTPGRLCDHLARGRLDLSALRVVVLDEADEMLNLGFREELETLLDAAPCERRTLLFSATIAAPIARLAARFQRSALRIDTAAGNRRQHADIDYRAVLCAPREEEHAVVNLLRLIEPRTALLFCATREMVRHLHGSLLERGFASVALSGELSQNERSRALEALRSGQARVCVATDVAARGLDLPDLSLVVQASVPTDKATLLHRSGRTGRAGRRGTSVLIVPRHRQRVVERLLREAAIDAAWSGPPTPEEVRARDGERLLADIGSLAPQAGATVDPEDQPLVEALVREHPPEALASAVLRLSRRTLPDPEEVVQITIRPPAPERPARLAPPAVGSDRGPDRASVGRAAGDSMARGTPSRWFRLAVGRNENADPKWLLPLICRRGAVGRRDVGAIRIEAHQTLFEISEAAAERFASSIEATDDDEVRIEQAAPPAGGDGPRGKAGAPAGRTSRPKRADAHREPSGRPRQGGRASSRRRAG